MTLKSLMSSLNKEYSEKGGDDIARIMSDSENEDIVRVPSGSLIHDFVLGGGIPLGRIIEIYGKESCGKTTICLQIIKSFQENGYNCAFIDLEHSVTKKYMRQVGVQDDKVLYITPPNGEIAFDTMKKIILSDEVKLIVVDSVSVLTPSTELSDAMEKQQMGLAARLMGKGLRSILPIASIHGCTVIFINQIREKIGVLYGSPETTSGGNALKFYATIRERVGRGEKSVEGGEVKGVAIKIKNIKNKSSFPHREGNTNIIFGVGVDTRCEVADLAIKYGFIDKKGSWFFYNVDGEETIKIGQGRDSVIKYLDENLGVYKLMEEKIKAKLNIKNG